MELCQRQCKKHYVTHICTQMHKFCSYLSITLCNARIVISLIIGTTHWSWDSWARTELLTRTFPIAIHLMAEHYGHFLVPCNASSSIPLSFHTAPSRHWGRWCHFFHKLEHLHPHTCTSRRQHQHDSCHWSQGQELWTAREVCCGLRMAASLCQRKKEWKLEWKFLAVMC